MRSASIFALIIALLVLLPTAAIHAAESPEQRLEKLEKQTEQHEQLLDGYQKLLEESKNFRENLQQQVQQVYSDVQTKSESMSLTFNITLTILSVLIITVQIYLAIVVGLSRKEVKQVGLEMKERAEKELQKQQKALQAVYEQRVKQMVEESKQKLQESINKEYDKLLQQLVEEDKYQKAIQRIIQRELSYTTARVCVVSKTDKEMERLQEFEIPLIRRFGLKEEIQSYSFESNPAEIEDNINNGEVDILIYSCEQLAKEKDKDEFLIRLADLLLQSKRDISLITYTSQRRLTKEEIEKTSKLIHTSANFPATLLSQLLSLAYVYSRDTSRLRSERN